MDGWMFLASVVVDCAAVSEHVQFFLWPSLLLPHYDEDVCHVVVYLVAVLLACS